MFEFVAHIRQSWIPKSKKEPYQAATICYKFNNGPIPDLCLYEVSV